MLLFEAVVTDSGMEMSHSLQSGTMNRYGMMCEIEEITKSGLLPTMGSTSLEATIRITVLLHCMSTKQAV